MFVSVEPGDEKNSHPGGRKNFFFVHIYKYTVTSAIYIYIHVYTLAHLGCKQLLM